MRRLFGLLALASCLSVPAFADSLIEIQAQNYAGPVDLIGLHPFDPSLGTLNSVSVSIIGNITGYITTIPNYGGLPYSVTISQDFGPGPFFFYAPAQTTLSGMSAGVGETIPFSLVFTYGFTFDSLSNLTGLANGSGGIGGLPPAGGIAGTLNGWQSSILPELLEIGTVTAQATGGASGVQGLLDTGGIIVQYNYETKPVTTPEPASVLLLGSGLIGLVGMRRKKFAR